MHGKKILISFVALAAFQVAVQAQSNQGGRTGMAFLKLGAGARATAMAEAYTALSADATSTWWNPAGLADLKKTHLTFTHTEWLQSISNDFTAIAFPALGGGAGLSVYTNRIDDIERRVIPSEDPLGTVDATDFAASASFARTLSDKISAGATIKYLYEKIYLESASGFAFDFGIQARPTSGALRLGVVIQNLGSVNELANESIRLPLTGRFGAAYSVEMPRLDGVVVVTAEGVKIRDTDFRAGFGLELDVRQRVALRVGYQSGVEERSISAGLGLHMSRFNLDYGYTPFSSNLGDTHRFSIGVEL